jgi:hypothetical protein
MFQEIWKKSIVMCGNAEKNVVLMMNMGSVRCAGGRLQQLYELDLMVDSVRTLKRSGFTKTDVLKILKIFGLDITEKDLEPYLKVFRMNRRTIDFYKMCGMVRVIAEEELRAERLLAACVLLDPQNNGTLLTLHALNLVKMLMHINCCCSLNNALELVWKNSVFNYTNVDLKKFVRIF